MENVTITLNGLEVSGHSGMTILDLARESGVEIPTLCHDPHLKPYGACRICLVEDERKGALLASCVTPIASGMVINTDSPKVLESRRTIVKLMLASHPDSCMVCDKGNRCQLRRIAADLGVGFIDFQRIPYLAAIEEVNPFIERDLSKCIMCAKCIRADQELVVEGAIDYLGRGFSSKPATLGDLPLEGSECTFCGTCVALCPTGALSEKVKSYRGTPSRVVSTVCPFCGCGCNINLEVNGDLIVRARPGEENSPNGVTLCVGGAYGYDFVHSTERILHPLVKANGEFKTVSWEEALDLAAERFTEIKKVHGPDSLTVLGSSKCTNEENYLLQKFARAVLGTNNIDDASRLYNSASHVVLGDLLGFPASTNPIDDIEDSETILLIGTDPSVSAPLVSYAIKRAVKQKGAKLVLMDSSQTVLDSFAHIRLYPKLGTDAILINGLMWIIIDKELWDQDFVSQRSGNFEALLASLQGYTPDCVEESTAVPAHDLLDAARLFAGANRAAIIYGDGIARRPNSVQSVVALTNLSLLTGNVGRSGGGIYVLQMDSNGQGASDMGCLPDFLPGYQSAGSIPGLTALAMIEQAKAGTVKGMYIMGGNPAVSFPDPSFAEEALSTLDLLVVQDIFLTETAKLADIVLPATSFAEKEGTFTNFERRVQRVRQAIRPLGESLPDWQIIQKLANRMHYSMSYSSPQEIMDEIRELVPIYQGIGYTEMEKGGMCWPGSNIRRSGTKRLYEGGFPEGFGRFSAVECRPEAGGSSPELPIGNALYHFGSGARSSRSARLSAMTGAKNASLSKVD